jgi:hypothetical protein
MKPSVLLIAASLLSLLLLMVHMTGDVLLQAEGHVKYPIPVVVFVVWLYGTLMLPARVSGHIIMLLGGLIGAGMIVVHSSGTVVRQSGGFYFVFTLFALSATSWFTAILAARGLWMAIRNRRAAPSVG